MAYEVRVKKRGKWVRYHATLYYRDANALRNFAEGTLGLKAKVIKRKWRSD